MLVLYHSNCPDGWCAAFICKLKYPEADLMGLNHGLREDELAALISGCSNVDVLMVDYSLRTRELNDSLNATAKSFRILDHHKTAQAVLEGAPYATFDMKRSGAGLAWDYLFGKDSVEKYSDGIERPWISRPWWVNYTEDQDLWNWALPDSQEINAYLIVQPRTVEIWKAFTQHATVHDAMRGGLGVRQYIEYYTKNAVADVQEGVFVFEGRNYRTGVLNMPYTGVSEACARLNEMGYEIGLAWFERGDGLIQFSMRSSKNSDVDVSTIAKFFGGGGHRTAAGFQVSIEKGREIVDTILGRKEYVPTSRCC